MKKVLFLIALVSCTAPTVGTFRFVANGEEIVREGFTSKEGWHITFDHLYVNIAAPRAFLPGSQEVDITLQGEHWLDLTSPPPLVTGALKKVPPGNYRALEFSLKKKKEGAYKGFSIVLEGRGVKEGREVTFQILLTEEVTFTGLEGYVGEEIKGLLPPGGTGEGEMTFHFDHLFGNNELPRENHVNSQAPGFESFLNFEKDGHIRVIQWEMAQLPVRDKLISAIHNLGHLGEGHCDASRTSSVLNSKGGAH